MYCLHTKTSTLEIIFESSNEWRESVKLADEVLLGTWEIVVKRLPEF